MHHTVDFLHQIHSVLFVPGVAILLVGDFPGSVCSIDGPSGCLKQQILFLFVK
jgi:hypothetical protein